MKIRLLCCGRCLLWRNENVTISGAIWSDSSTWS